MVGDALDFQRQNGSSLKSDTLALLYQGLFTGIVRIQAGRQAMSDPETFRRRMKLALQEVQREAGAAGYSSDQSRDAEFAVVAFLDEAILCSNDPGREQWRKKTLNVELYGEAVAGEVFFEKLTNISRKSDSTQVIDLLEVYLMCLLLGFQGRYSGPLAAEGNLIAERLRTRIDNFRGTGSRLCPAIELSSPIADKVRAAASRTPQLLWTVGPAACALVLFALFKLNLAGRVSHLESLFSNSAR